MRCLLIETDRTSREALEKVLSEHGDCDTVADGRTAIHMFKKAYDDGAPYEVVLLNVELSPMNGYEMLREIRSVEGQLGLELADGVHAVMMADAYGPASVKLAKKLGCETCLAEPITPDKVVGALTQCGVIAGAGA